MPSPTPDIFRTLLTDLTALPGLSGLEDAVIGYMADHLRPLADAVHIDVLGNVIARFGAADRPGVAVLAHMDSVGLMVKRHNLDGSLGVVPVGGVNLKALSGTTVRLGNLPGLIGVRSQHQAQPNDATVNADDLYVMIGRQSADAALPEITTPVIYATGSLELAGNIWCAPHLDNRAGCAVLLALAGLLHDAVHEGGSAALPYPVYLIGTVQEETTCQGAQAALQQVGPSAALFVDGTVSYDTPETRGRGSVALGAGPVLTSFLYVSGLNGWHAHPALRTALRQTASTGGIAYQQDAVHGLMSDARVATPLGIPSALLGLPMRGKHSPQETISLDDLVAAVQLLEDFLRQPLPPLHRGR